MSIHRIRNRRQSWNSDCEMKITSLNVICGCTLFIIGFGLLYWNENKTIATIKTLEEALSAVVSLQSAFTVSAENNGKLIHTVGPLDIPEPLAEVEYGVSIPAVKLKRRVQMYQWIEQETLNDNSRDIDPSSPKYDYYTEWKDKLIDSTRFAIKSGHHNPKKYPLKSTVYINDRVNIGFFSLSAELKYKFNDFILVTSDERPERRDIRMHSGLYYHSEDVWNPEVGDIRVQFSYAGKAGDIVTVVGLQDGNTIRPFKTDSGKEILILRNGFVPVQDIFHQEHAPNLWLIWLFRFIGGTMMYHGISFFSSPLKRFFSRYSQLEELIILGFGSICVAATLCSGIGVIAYTWSWYRPFFGLSLIVTSFLPFVYAALKMYFGKKEKKEC